jgi:hypothetical protein
VVIGRESGKGGRAGATGWLWSIDIDTGLHVVGGRVLIPLIGLLTYDLPQDRWIRGSDMTDRLLADTDRAEAMSLAYVHAIAAGAGYVVGTMNFDRDGVDAEIKAGGAMRPSIGLQLKATTRLGSAIDGVFRFPLRRRNYDLLRIPTQVPRVLIVLDLPDENEEWLRVMPDKLVLKRRAFWASLAGYAETENVESVTISLREDYRFNVESLRDLMDRSRTGVI